ncbi:TVA1 protein, partial [Amia calva]|nr:TVA1 protein [Amia calva]
GQEAITPQSDKVTAKEGQTAAIQCNYKAEKSYGAYLQWYKVDKNEGPQFLLQTYSFDNEKKAFTKGYTATLDTENQLTTLTVKNVTLSDSKTFICALR